MDAEVETPSTDVVNIRIIKAGNKKIPVDVSQLNDQMFKMVVEAGLEALLNTKMSKVKSGKALEELDDKAKAEFLDMAMEKAEENLAKLYDGTFKKGRAATTDASGKKIDAKTMTEAMRLARNVVRDGIKAAGGKISHYAASDITEAAKEILANDPSILEEAKANLAKRTATPAKVDISALIKPSPKLVKAAEAKAAEAKEERAKNKGTLSATQAGKVKVRPQTHA